MQTWTLLRRSLWHYRRTHAGVVLGAALGALVLTGALLVGSSVQATLRRQAEQRVGQVHTALLAGDRFVRPALAQEVGGHNAAALLLRGSVARADAQARVNQAQVLGVDDAFWRLAPPGAHQPPALTGAQALLNTRLAQQLNAKAGDTVILRLEKPSAFSKDAPLSGEESDVVALRVQVMGVVAAADFGNFALQANQVPPFTIFLPQAVLAQRLELKEASANVLLTCDEHSPETLRAAVAKQWQLADAGLQVRPLAGGAGTELRTARVFLDAPVAQAAPGGQPSATYLVNEIRSGEQAVPYSMATAVDAQAAGLLPTPLQAGEAAISQWTADDLKIGVGAKLSLKYFVMAERRQLTEQTREFTVRAVLPMTTPGLDGSWMPDFPGLSDKANCRDWEPGFALDTKKIRDQDEAYWDKYRGTPKVFIPLPDGQGMWRNRWGDTTALRFPAGQEPKALLSKLTPEGLGLTFASLPAQAQAALKAPVDFGELFVSFSFFLLAAAAALTGLLFVFALEQRNEEAGLLLALGWPAARVRRLLLAEGLVLAVVGSLAGTALAVLYTHAVLRALATVWRGAVGAVQFTFAAPAGLLLTGLVSGVVLALLGMWLASRRQLKQSAGSLLAQAGTFEMARADAARGRTWSWWVAAGCAGAAVAILAVAREASPEVFFSAGGLLLVAGIAAALGWLRRVAERTGDAFSLAGLGAKNAARRRWRSVATIAILASGIFMVVAVDAFRQRPSAEAAARHGGTGGFALYGESALPIYEDLNTAQGREAFALQEPKLAGVAVVPLRLREGDDASCLNLNRALQPRLLGVRPEELAERGAFRFAKELGSDGWAALRRRGVDGAIPAVVDATTLQYALQKKLGDTITYQDERGQLFTVQLVASVGGSILQGSLVVAEQFFTEKFPSQGGYRAFLVDAPADRTEAVAKEFSRALQDRGLELTPTLRRLGEFQAVENTYLSIFQALGGLGLLLGSLGVAIVVGRNVLERRQEFGLLGAVGFRLGQLRQLVFLEHRWLLGCGLAIGIISALVAVWPGLRAQHGGGFPWLEMGGLLAALALGTLLWVWLATRLALRKEPTAALRSE